jgi:plasmid stabilization system protein ParE
MTGYDFHPEGRLDLDEIWEFIRAENLDAADRTIAEILAATVALVPFPEQGHRRPDLTSRPLRFILVREYPIACAPEEKPLWVVAIIHGRRSPRVMAAILRDRELPRPVFRMLRRVAQRFGFETRAAWNSGPNFSSSFCPGAIEDH